MMYEMLSHFRASFHFITFWKNQFENGKSLIQSGDVERRERSFQRRLDRIVRNFLELAEYECQRR